MKKIFSIVLLSLIFTGNAHAYLDPGTGSILLQGLLAGLLAIGVFWRKLKDYVMGRFSKKNHDDRGS